MQKLRVQIEEELARNCLGQRPIQASEYCGNESKRLVKRQEEVK